MDNTPRPHNVEKCIKATPIQLTVDANCGPHAFPLHPPPSINSLFSDKCHPVRLAIRNGKGAL